MSGASTGSPGTPHDISRALTKASRSNFYYAFLFLPRVQREALYSVYAFCRVSDDLVDETADGVGAAAGDGGSPPGTTRETMERLKSWRAELEACFRGEARHPVLERLSETLQTFRIPRHYFEELLNGVEMDLVKTRYASFAELQQYCYRVAGVVGLMCIEIFGYRRPETRIYAEHLGTAFQLTNILRDLGPDLDRGRLYLPQEDLARFGVSEADIAGGRRTPALRELMAFEADRARRFYEAARAALPAEDRRGMLAPEIMGAIYARLLHRIEASDYDVFTRRIRLSDAERMWLALTCWLRHHLTRR
jgi:15-cis-phytoene synthase